MATLFKLLTVVNADLSPSFQTVIVVVSIASMTVGNIMALRQRKRMLYFQVYPMLVYVNDYLKYYECCGTLLYYIGLCISWYGCF
jgi:NADH-quinone oxidoreductase subunit N